MPREELFSTASPLAVSDMNSLVQQTQILNELSEDPSKEDTMSEELELRTFAKKVDLASAAQSGLMSKDDKSKLDKISVYSITLNAGVLTIATLE